MTACSIRHCRVEDDVLSNPTKSISKVEENNTSFIASNKTLLHFLNDYQQSLRSTSIPWIIEIK